jgi:beta-galactosidase/beta-glucuronidase
MAGLSDVYPRSDFQRPQLNWELLNGTWDFAFDDNDIGIAEKWHLKELPSKQNITVPFAFQTSASGINNQGAHEFIWYRRPVKDIRTNNERSNSYRLILRFGAVDYEANVWINDHYVGSHRGGHVPFDLDITNALSHALPDKEAYLTVRVRDSPHDLTQPRGKQYWKPKSEAIWYTPTSGIWQSVWLESVAATRLGHSGEGTRIVSNDIDNGILHTSIAVVGQRPGQKLFVEIEASLAKVPVAKLKGPVSNLGCATIKVPLHFTPELLRQLPKSFLERYPLSSGVLEKGLATWAPEHPVLYDIVLRLFDEATGNLLDEVITYTGIRSITWDSQCVKLNGNPYFQALVLDQGFWPETGLTPPSPDALKEDIILAKNMGFNGCRKHQKVEDPVFLYWADHLGYLVWGEMANAYEFSELYVDRFNEEWVASMKRDINHPCVVTWTPINESWGYKHLPDSASERNHIRSLYFITK